MCHSLALSSDIEIDSLIEVSIDIKECPGINRLEHVTANVSFVFHRRGDVKITLISSSYTSSELLSYRDRDATSKGLSLLRNPQIETIRSGSRH